jgi:hypothetical protein
MQPLRFIQQATSSASARTPENTAAHFCFQLSNQSFSQPASFSNQQIRENQDSRERISREDHYTPEKFRMECVGKTRCAAYRIPAVCWKFVRRISHTGAGEGI